MVKTFKEPGREKPLSSAEIDRLLFQLKRDRPGPPAFASGCISDGGGGKDTAGLIDHAVGQVEDIFAGARLGKGVGITAIKKDILPAIRTLADIPGVSHVFHQLDRKDRYTSSHAVCVSMIAGMIGRWLGIGGALMEDLLLGSILHDIGKIKIPDEILSKPGKLTLSEYEEMKLHSVYGYEMVRDLDAVSPKAALIVLQHHEREDGRGYPLGLKGREIEHLAKITAIADVFHAMSSARIYHEALPFYQVMRKMKDGAFGSFEPGFMLIFIQNLMNSLAGSRVRLTDQSEGRILMIHPYDPLSALVQTEDRLIDLRYSRGLQIERIL
ncbi:HD-GYP domain-containing protein [Bacillus infantis]|uniref:HD-GYP domain-containing protein n=1 Tax=Bacillus infantis TaxID=324767 RepID=A0A5D4STI0_9BACI|nr:HD-GYP domain-containing protein [Bacillus infantis]MCP1159488.1 HD-GYP domain-containing protein [Bacillus infantis]TYS66640.1 HD-GYP domain-containing protein [Bacillus infantis]